MIQVEGTFGGGSKINGVKGEYLATANISKGDFVQLTTKGVEEVAALTKALEWDGDATNTTNASVAVLSSTKVMVVWYKGGATYAQVVTYKNAAWITGTPVLLSSLVSTSVSVGIGRLTNLRVAAHINANTTADCKVLILEVSENGEITVVAESGVGFRMTAESSTIGNHVVGLTPSKFVIAGNKAANSVNVCVCTYVDEVLHVSEEIMSISGIHFQMVKLTDDSIFASYYISSSSADYGKVYFVADDIITEIASIKDGDPINLYGKPISLYDNKILFISLNSAVGGICELSYDSTNGIVKNSIMGSGDILSGTLYGAEKIGDNKICVYKSKGSSDPMYFDVYDINTGEITSNPIYEIPGGSITNAKDANLVDAGFGWFALIGDTSKLWIAPCVSQTTAAPYSTRLDGVASKGATAGQMAEVITP